MLLIFIIIMNANQKYVAAKAFQHLRVIVILDLLNRTILCFIPFKLNHQSGQGGCSSGKEYYICITFSGRQLFNFHEFIQTADIGKFNNTEF